MKHMNPNFYFKILDSQQLIFLASNMKQICWQNTWSPIFSKKNQKILKRQKYYFQAPSPKYYYETTNSIVEKYHKP